MNRSDFQFQTIVVLSLLVIVFLAGYGLAVVNQDLHAPCSIVLKDGANIKHEFMLECEVS